jgi:hypothetical protein
MTFQLQIDKNSFRFHIIYMGMKPLRRTPQRQQANQKKRDISNEVRKGTFLKRFDNTETNRLSPSQSGMYPVAPSPLPKSH